MNKNCPHCQMSLLALSVTGVGSISGTCNKCLEEIPWSSEHILLQEKSIRRGLQKGGDRRIK